MGDDLTAAAWAVAAASVRGRDHVRSGLPCQDAHRVAIGDGDAGRGCLIVVVSDGAGSAAHSDVGSEVTADGFVAECEALLQSQSDVATWTREDAATIVASIQARLDARAEEMEIERRDLAATLVGAVITEGAAAFLQIGDGAMVTPSDDGGWMWVHWPDQGEYANTTFFVTQPAEVHKLQFDVTDRPVDSLALFSDGLQSMVLKYADRSVAGPFFDRMDRSLRGSGRTGLNEELSSGLAEFLTSDGVSSRSGDDITLVIAAREKR